tara:strand:+ start:3217 stop:3507 length:291 start_codon:yes stop_codon:yes gene_type:complete
MSDDKIVYINNGHSPEQKEQDDKESLQTMLECIKVVGDKVLAGEVEGMVTLTFNKDQTSEDYMTGMLDMSKVSHVLLCTLINNVLMTQIQFKDIDD